MRAIVILGDLKASRRKESRETVGRKIRASLEGISERFEEYLVTDFDIQRGIDEFGGVLKAGAASGEILVELWKALHPHAVRFSLVEGPLDVVPQARSPSIHEFDGPALHVASEALDTMDREGKLVNMERDGRQVDPSLIDVANLLYFQLLDWTPHQLEVYEAYGRMESQAEVADHFAISQPTVSEILQKVRSRFMRRAFEDWRKRVREAFGGST